MTNDYWLGYQNADPNTDPDTWCLVRDGDPFLTGCAADLPGTDLMQTITRGGRMVSTRAGRYVRPGGFAVVLIPDGLNAAKRGAARLAETSLVAPADRCAVALAGPTRGASILVAEILAVAADEPELATAWAEGARRAIATGSPPVRVEKHRAVAEGLHGRTPSADEVADWMALRLSEQSVRHYNVTGLSPADAQRIERAGACDPTAPTASPGQLIP